ncbi:sugar kinase [Streptomyces jumonjinensis]|uniref:sugar kinase n=1 Tax=Streptomyces jumonjinensis TaxID=1945 RepID=UPI001297F64D
MDPTAPDPARSPRVSSLTGTAAVDVADVICLGESMVTFLPSRPGRLADVPSFARAIGGAESNAACALAAAGHRVKWVSRVGADGFGDHLIEAIAAYGVDTSAVGRDPLRPTGVYFRTATDRAADAHEVVYYRRGSAASAMSPATVPYQELAATRVLHISGITAALSADCLALMRELTTRRPGRPLVSFDVNHRPGLWRDASGARVLLELARGADLVFVGEDEAEAAWGVHGAAAIREALPEPAVVVVKQGAKGATVFATSAPRPGDAKSAPRPGDAASAPSGGRGDGHTESAPPAGPRGDGRADSAPPAIEERGPGQSPGKPPHLQGANPPDTITFAPAPRVDVIAPVGAGDAFAAGYLSGLLRALPTRDRLRHGHLWAAAALTVPGDLARPPAAAHADRLAALDDAAWERLRLGPGWTSAADEEVRTP